MSQANSRYDRLIGYLAADADNLTLIADAADAALAEGRFAEASAMVDRHARIAPPPPSLINALGLCALAEGRHEDAAGIFESLLAGSPDDPGLQANLAWARSRLDDHAAVVDAVSGAGRSADAAALKVRALHHLGLLEEAVAIGEAWEGQAGSADLWGALADVALDAEETDRAAVWAGRAGDTVEGLAARGMLAMGEARPAEARALFDRALAQRPDSARALIGLGTVLLEEGHAEAAASRFDAAGEIFGDHLGVWIAAGWAWLVAGNAGLARARFDKVVALDDTFSEAWGGLAVLDVMGGRPEEAGRFAEVALRLDRRSMGGALARTLLLEESGDAEQAARVRTLALDAPVGPNGRSVAQMMALAAARNG